MTGREEQGEGNGAGAGVAWALKRTDNGTLHTCRQPGLGTNTEFEALSIILCRHKGATVSPQHYSMCVDEVRIGRLEVSCTALGQIIIQINMKKMKHLLSILFLMLSLSSCDDKVKSLEYRVDDLKEELDDVKSELTELKDEINSNSQFEKEMQCQEMLDRLKRRWNNVVGCYYNSYYNTCMVKYKFNGEVKVAKIEEMSDTD
jgi:hypothetical protein